jgi:hypothetical protein
MRFSTLRLPSTRVTPIGVIALVITACAPAPAETPADVEVDVIRPITLTENARMPESDRGLTDVQVESDRLVFLYTSPPERPLAVGDVVSGVKQGGYLRRITEIVSSTATRVEVLTAHAELVEFIADGHFRAQFHSRRDSSYRSEDGVGLATGSLRDGVPLLAPGVPLRGTCGTEFGLDVSPIFEADLDTDMDIDIGGGLLGLLRGRLQSARFIVDGEVEVGATVVSMGARTIECRWDLSSALAGVVPSWKWQTTFMVGPIPIVVTHTIEPGLGLALGGDAYSSTTTSTYSGRLALRAGIEYTEDAGWDAIWEPEADGTAGVTAREPGQLRLSASVMASVGYIAKLYDTVGVGLSIGPTLQGDFTVASDRCTWNAEARMGLDLNVSVPVTIPFFDTTLAAYSTRRTLAETTLVMETGVLPWCDSDGGVPMNDPCNEPSSSCESCNGRAGCGFCPATGECMSDSRRGECDSWRDSLSECIDCGGHTDCASCVGDAFCGWCASSGTCLTAPSGGGAPASCTAWNDDDVGACG